ncbi:MAG: tRNA lysidine(34) synthetase TilS [Actinomycetaceae bacterium]|nr:tRNA lysidine(34) synthetase TilS [Actinomycetaceae bacterium]
MSLVSELIGSTPPPHTRAVTLALRHALARHEVEAASWVVACSGGPDSLALTFAAADLASRAGASCKAVIVDHGLRPESAEEAQATLDLLRRWEIEAVVVAVEVGETGGVEAAAREARYRALREHSEPGSLVLLGHTMDDQAETVLLGLARGSGTRSLSGMREIVRDERTWMRPLLTVRRFDTEGMCQELGLTPVEDPSNRLHGGWTTASGAPLPRVAVRHLAIPALSKALGRDTVPLLARSASLLDLDASALEQITREKHEPGASLIVEELAGLPVAVRTRILKNAAEQAGATSLQAAHITELNKLVDGYAGGGPIHLPGNVIAWREKEEGHGKYQTTRRVVKMMKKP